MFEFYNIWIFKWIKYLVDELVFLVMFNFIFFVVYKRLMKGWVVFDLVGCMLDLLNSCLIEDIGNDF